MPARIVEIAEAIGQYISDNAGSLPIVINKIIVAPFAIEKLDESIAPNLYVSYQTTQQSEEESFRDVNQFVYSISLILVDFTQLGTDVELEDLTLLMESIRNLLRDTEQAGADFWSIGDEAPVEELDAPAVETGQYFRSELPVQYIEYLVRA